MNISDVRKVIRPNKNWLIKYSTFLYTYKHWRWRHPVLAYVVTCNMLSNTNIDNLTFINYITTNIFVNNFYLYIISKLLPA